MNPIRHDSSELSQIVYLTQPTERKTARGTVTQEYLHENRKGPFRASVEPYGAYIRNGEALQADVLQCRIVLRFRKWIKKETLVEYDGIRLKQSIAPLDVNGKHEWLRLTCEELE